MNRREYQRRLILDPIFYAEEVWKEIGRDKVAPLDDIDRDLILWGASTTPSLRGALAWRGMGKTHLVPLICGSWRLLRDYRRKVLIISRSGSHAKFVVRTMRAWFKEIWFLQHLYPTGMCADREHEFEVPGMAGQVQPSVRAIGIDGQLEGNRAHSIYGDDVETANNTITLDARTDLYTRCAEFTNIVYPDPIEHTEHTAADPSEVMMIGTFKSEESLYLKMADGGYEFRTYPIAAPQRSDRFLNLAPIIREKLEKGDLEYTLNEKYHENPVSKRFNGDTIRQRMSQKQVFRMENMLATDMGSYSGYPLRLGDLIVESLDVDRAYVSMIWGRYNHKDQSTTIEDIKFLGQQGDCLRRAAYRQDSVAPYTKRAAYIDIAGRGSDQCVVATGGAIAGYIHCFKLIGLPGGASEDDMRRLAMICRESRVSTIRVERNADITGTWMPLFKKQVKALFVSPCPEFPEGWRAAVETDTATGWRGHKEKRIVDTLESVMSNHRLVVDRSVVTPVEREESKYDFQYQLSHITRQRKCLVHDDKVDALAGLVDIFNFTLMADPEKEREKLLEQDIDKELTAMRRARMVGIDGRRGKSWLHPERV